jgi:methionyl aminopeptidase
MLLRTGMTVALEPMLLIGSPATRVLQDQWTVASLNHTLTGHFEHTVSITSKGPRILTLLGDDTPPVQIAGHFNKLPV